MGNITRDIELKYTQTNQAVATVGLAVNRKYKGADGQLKEDVTFVDCDAWGKTAEMISQYFAKGRPIFIEGRLRLDTWKDKQDGSNRSKLKVVIENFQFVDSKRRRDAPRARRVLRPRRPRPRPTSRSRKTTSRSDPSIAFNAQKKRPPLEGRPCSRSITVQMVTSCSPRPRTSSGGPSSRSRRRPARRGAVP